MYVTSPSRLGNSSPSSATALSTPPRMEAQSSIVPNFSPSSQRALSHLEAKMVRALILLSANASFAFSIVFSALRSGSTLAFAQGFGCNGPLEENVEPLFELSAGGGKGGEILRLFRDCDGWVVVAGCAGWVPTGDNVVGVEYFVTRHYPFSTSRVQLV